MSYSLSMITLIISMVTIFLRALMLINKKHRNIFICFFVFHFIIMKGFFVEKLCSELSLTHSQNEENIVEFTNEKLLILINILV